VAPRGLGPARLVEVVSLVPGFVGWICVLAALDVSFENLLVTAALPFAVMLTGLSVLSLGNGVGFRWLAAAGALTGVSGNLLLEPSVTASSLCLVVAIVTVAYGFFAAGSKQIVKATGRAVKSRFGRAVDKAAWWKNPEPETG